MLSREGALNVCKFFVLQHNVAAATENKTTYKKYLRVAKENEWGFTKKTPIRKLYWHKPSQEVLDVYIPMQNKFKALIRNDMSKKGKEDKDKIDTNIKKIGRREKAIELYKKGILTKDIANVLRVNLRSVQLYIKEYKQSLGTTLGTTQNTTKMSDIGHYK